MYSDSIRTTRLHRAVRDALRSMRRPAALASITLATGAGATALPALALDAGPTAATVGSHAAVRSSALLVLDPGVDHAEALLTDLPSGVRVARLPADVEPLRGLEMLLEAHPGTRELHVVSHGAPGPLVRWRRPSGDRAVRLRRRRRPARTGLHRCAGASYPRPHLGLRRPDRLGCRRRRLDAGTLD